MWDYKICEKGGIYISKDSVTLLSNKPSKSLEENIKNSIKYVTDLINLNINNSDKDMIQFISMGCEAISKLNKMWENI